MRAGKLLLQITAYYVIIALVIFVALKLWPELRGYLPIGGVEQLISNLETQGEKALATMAKDNKDKP